MVKTISYYTVSALLIFCMGFGVSYSACSLFNVGATNSGAQASRSMPMMRMR